MVLLSSQQLRQCCAGRGACRPGSTPPRAHTAMKFVSKLSPEQWAEAKRLRAGGATYEAIAHSVGIAVSAVSSRARREGWPAPASAHPAPAAPRRAAPKGPSPATASIRGRLALRLYAVIECKIRMMELRMIK